MLHHQEIQAQPANSIRQDAEHENELKELDQEAELMDRALTLRRA